MKYSILFVTLPIWGSLLTGCLAPTAGEEDEPLGSAEGAVEYENSLIPNGLVPNSLIPNALVPNSLVPNALSMNALAPAATSAIKDEGAAGALSRMFLKYTVKCAFDPTQSFAFSWTDTSSVVHNEVYWGELGLATNWASGSISPGIQEKVSACLAARTNYYGTSVTISLRANGTIDKAGTAELTTYPAEEGAFWGNVFAPSPSLRACYQPANAANSRSKLRDCAAGHLTQGGVTECGIIHIIGSCDTWCDPLNQTSQYRPKCIDDPAVSLVKTASQVISVFLPSP